MKYKTLKFFFIFIAVFCISQAGGWTPAYATVLLDSSSVGTTYSRPAGGYTTWSMYGATSSTYATAVTQTTSSLNMSTVAKIRVSADHVPYNLVNLTQAGTTGTTCTPSGSWTNVSGNLYEHDVSGCSGTFGGLQVFSNASSTTLFDGNGSASSMVFDGSATLVGAGSLAFQLCDSGGCSGGFTPPAPPNTMTRIVDGIPNPGANTGSTTVVSAEDYYWNSSSPWPTGATQIVILIKRQDATEPDIYHYHTLVNDTLTSVSDSDTLTSGGLYSIQRYFARADGSFVMINDPYTFGVVSVAGLPSIYVPFPDVVPPASCDTWDFTCYINSAVSWAFVPTSDSLTQWNAITLKNSFPFSYIYDIGTAYNELFSNSGSMTYAVSANTGALGTINFISASQISAVPYASTIKTLLGYILWFFTGMFIYRVLLKAHD